MRRKEWEDKRRREEKLLICGRYSICVCFVSGPKGRERKEIEKGEGGMDRQIREGKTYISWKGEKGGGEGKRERKNINIWKITHNPKVYP